MRKLLFVISIGICFYFEARSQETEQPIPNTLLKELAANGCKCIDSITTYNKPNTEVATEISNCIDKQTSAYQMGSMLAKVDELKETAEIVNGKKQINISINNNENSAEYKKYYYELERYMVKTCNSLKEKMATNEKQSLKSFSENSKAVGLYTKGLDEMKKEKFVKAIEYLEKAVKEDPEFAFAWDNLGLSYRKIDNYDKALESYNKSLEIDPNGLMPLQNIAIVYRFKKEYQKAIDAYKKLADIDKDNPETFYGIGNIYATYLSDYKNGLENMCKAYTIYIEQKSPYRADAEKIINNIYVEMKKQGKEDEFNEILKSNGISQTK